MLSAKSSYRWVRIPKLDILKVPWWLVPYHLLFFFLLENQWGLPLRIKLASLSTCNIWFTSSMGFHSHKLWTIWLNMLTKAVLFICVIWTQMQFEGEIATNYMKIIWCLWILNIIVIITIISLLWSLWILSQ